MPFIDLKSQYARLKPEIDRNIQAVLDHCQYIMGPEVARCEAELAAYTGARHCVSVGSGTDALLIALMAEGVGPGDAVFVPSFTFTATAEVVLLLGAQPVFVDVDPRAFNLSLADLERRLGEARRRGDLRPKAVIAVDLFGLPADYGALTALCEREDLFLIADAAQSIGASVRNRRVGALAPVTTASFFPAKPLGCYGDGGALFTDDADRAKVYDSIRQHGKGDDRYEIVRVGINGRFDTIQAAVILAKLRVFDDEIERRQHVAARYSRNLRDSVVVPVVAEGSVSAWAQYSVLSDRRDQVVGALKREGIPTAIHYPRPMHLQPAYAAFGHGPGSLPVSESLSTRIFSLPMHAYLDDATVDAVSDAVRRALR
jgi:dTDP-4-amino-4,6-dideoxygalactose transaminase